MGDRKQAEICIKISENNCSDETEIICTILSKMYKFQVFSPFSKHILIFSEFVCNLMSLD